MEGAIAWYQRALDLDPLNAFYAVRLAGIYLEIGETEQALLFAYRSMELDTMIASVRVPAAWVYRDLG